jgi:hypothetical protein
MNMKFARGRMGRAVFSNEVSSGFIKCLVGAEEKKEL